MSTRTEAKGHSEHNFGEYRDHWWDKKFLDLMAERLQLKHHKKVLDVGCGRFHWSKLLVPYLTKNAEVTGVDNDPKWARVDEEITAYFNHYEATVNALQAEATELPFDNATFDLVTCQTVLIHLEHPAVAIAEMKRVLKPNGTILLAEPNNQVQTLIRSSLSSDKTLTETLDHIKYSLICEKGRQALGLGDSSIGDLLPGMLAKRGFRDIEVRLSDKSIAMYPPYDNEEQMATLKQWFDTGNRSSEKISDKDLFKAAGEQYMEFYDRYNFLYKNQQEELVEALQEETYHTAGGAMMYLVSGKR